MGKKGYGCIPDLPDQRDFTFMPQLERAALPALVQMREQFPPVYDQKNLGSCTGQSARGVYQFTALEQKLNATTPSALYIYYNSRVLHNTVDWDSGASIRNAMKSMAQYGICHEAQWPYRVTRFAEKPPKKCYDYGAKTMITEYARVAQEETAIKTALAGNNPIVFGFSVYDSFNSAEVARTGRVPMPGVGERVNGGHAMVLTGYDNKARDYFFRNSWGKAWGDGGYGRIPFDLIHNTAMAFDFWTLMAVPR